MLTVYNLLDSELFPSLTAVLQVALTVAVSSCSSERSFSAMRWLHTWLRRTMGQSRLQHLNGMSVEKEMLEKHSGCSAPPKPLILESPLPDNHTFSSPSNVVFSASLVTTSDLTYQGPFTTYVTLIFKRVVTNVGNRYNSDTGIFTAPTKGVYYFSFTGCMGKSGKLDATLVKNSEFLFEIHDTWGSTGCGSNSMTVQLEEGDTIFIHLWQGFSIFDQSRLSTFTSSPLRHVDPHVCRVHKHKPEIFF
uniref:C1q domain-containing protein n=1 Tax=Sphaeramia orbicularis TaxID=375764 RepID=A0A673AFJ9_9TELE